MGVTVDDRPRAAPSQRRAAPAIALRGVVKRFGEITAVAGLDLEVPPGICLGLLGPNGAGKSTTMRMLTAQSIPDEGSIEVLGYKIPERLEAGARRDGRRARSSTTSTSS